MKKRASQKNDPPREYPFKFSYFVIIEYQLLIVNN